MKNTNSQKSSFKSWYQLNAKKWWIKAENTRRPATNTCHVVGASCRPDVSRRQKNPCMVAGMCQTRYNCFFSGASSFKPTMLFGTMSSMCTSFTTRAFFIPLKDHKLFPSVNFILKVLLYIRYYCRHDSEAVHVQNLGHIPRK